MRELRSELECYFHHQCVHPRALGVGESHECVFCRKVWLRESESRWASEGYDDFEIIGVTIRYGDGVTASFPG